MISKPRDIRSINLSNGVSLDLVEASGSYPGIGEVRLGDTVLRSGRRPMSVEIRTTEGVQITRFHLLSERIIGDSVVLEFGMSAQHGGAMDWMLHEVRPRVNTADWAVSPEPLAGTRLSLTLTPVVKQVGAELCTGFSYQYHYVSNIYPIYKITDRSTWEVGGQSVSNEFYLRNVFGPSIYPIHACTQTFSSEWYLGSAMNSSIFQFLPWQTALEGFSLTCHSLANVMTWCTEVAHIRSLFEKQPGYNEMAHWHEHCGDLSLSFETAPMEVLCIEGARDPVGRLNLYHALREHVAEELHRQIGMRRERVTTYGVIEEWGLADMTRYHALGLPKLIDAGVKTIMLPSHFQNNMNVYGVSNMCCTIDLKVADSVGEDKLTSFCQSALDAGVEITMWGNTSISTLGLKSWEFNAPSDNLKPLPREGSIMEMIDQAADPFVRNPAGHLEADHYAPHFAVLNLRDESVRRYWLEHWAHAHDAIGLRGIFVDSSFNLSTDKFHWIANTQAHTGASGTADQIHLLGGARPHDEPRKAILSQYRAYLDLMTAMQGLGYTYSGEDNGVFGVHRAGAALDGQINSMPLWSDCVAEFNPAALQAAGADPDHVYFRGMAYRHLWRLFWDIDSDALSWRGNASTDPNDTPTAFHLDLIKIYNAVEPDLRNRKILVDEQAVVYSNGPHKILWVFEDMAFALSDHETVVDLTTGSEVVADRRFIARRQHVYRIEADASAFEKQIA